MARPTTRRRILRRYILFRASFAALVIVVGGAVAISTGSVVVAVIIGVLAIWQAGMTIVYVVLYQRADSTALDAPIDSSQLPSWRYLRPKRYPYLTKVESRTDSQD